MFNNRINSKNSGFTLIELLVVVAIIGILSTVVIASLNGAREKGKIATIKSTLKQLYNQATLNQLEKGSFIYSNPSYTDLTCTGLKADGTIGDVNTGNLAKIAKPLIDQGIIVKCFSYSSTPLSDVYQRFGATALIYNTTELKAWSIDENGIVKWDNYGLTSANLPGGDTKNWDDAKTACANNGGRLPSIEQFRTLYYAWYQGSTNTTYTPISFDASNYWSSVSIPGLSSQAYYQFRLDGILSYGYQTERYYTHCVR